MTYMEKTKRKDLVKYKAPTKVISFRCDKTFTGTGTDARKILIQFFKALVSSLSKTQFENFKKLYYIQIDNINKILAIDIRKEI